VSTGNPDLFVICKSCGAEVSPYITECPYCGNRLRKRAPKLDREGQVAERRRRRMKRPPSPSLGRLRRGEMPGIRPDARPYASLALVLTGIVGCLLWRTTVFAHDHLVVWGEKPGSHWWRLITSTFVYDNLGYAFVALGAIMLFGWLLERRHGPVSVAALFILGGIGGTAATAAVYASPFVVGAGGAALAMVIAWAIPDLLSLRRGEEIEGDLLGAGVIALVVALIPVAVTDASWVSDAVGALGGVAIGLPLALSSR
jgi:membrane associated rhomboid family serine protease